jgi:mannosyltransferase PIG-M
VPLGIAWVWRLEDRRRALAWTALVVATCAAVFLPFAAVAPAGLGHSFGTQLSRPLQIESLGAAILIALHHAAGLAIVVRSDHGSQNIESTGAQAAAVVTTLLGALALCAIWVAFARGPALAERLAAAAAASVATFMAFGKVFSPQFMIWLIPLVPLVRSRIAPLLFAAGLVLTQLWFPSSYWDLVGLDARESWLLLARDLVVVALAAALYVNVARDSSGRRAGSRAAPQAAA